jgi:energy-coupling factor transport system substrate-specific component
MQTSGNKVSVIQSSRGRWGYSTQELVLIAVTGVIFGVLNVFLGALPQWGGAVAGPLAAAALGGFVQISQCLTGWIVRRPGIATLTMMINVATQFLAGNPAGTILFAFGAAQGFGAEIAFLLKGYKNFTVWTMLLAGGLANVGSQVMFVFLFGWKANQGSFYLSLLVAFLASTIEAGLIAWLLAKALDHTGLIRSIRKQSTPVGAL